MTPFILLASALTALALAMLLAPKPTPLVAAARPKSGLIVFIVLWMLTVATGGYAMIGSPRLLAVAPVPGDDKPRSMARASVIADALQARARERSTDPLAWYQWARAELDLGHTAQAVQGYRQALALRPRDADLLAEAADVLTIDAQAHLENEALGLIDRALAIDPNQLKALALQGGYAASRRDYPQALAIWEHALRVAPAGHPIVTFLSREIAAVRMAAKRDGKTPIPAALPRSPTSSPSP